MFSLLTRAYVFVFARRRFARLNAGLFGLGIRGLGVLNYRNRSMSGESGFLRSYLRGKEDCVVFDVGANVGDYSREVIDNARQARIYAFEPHPATYERLRANLEGCENIFNLAVGSRESNVRLYDYQDNDGSSHASVFRAVIEEIHRSEAVSHEVKMITLDSFVESRNITRIDLLKIDTEGNELDVLKGAARAISEGKILAIHFEFNEMNVISRTFFRDFWEALPNYAFYRMVPNGLLRIAQYQPLSCEIYAYQNIVALKQT